MQTLPEAGAEGRRMSLFFNNLKLLEGFLLLVYFSYEDIRCRRISIYALLAGFATAAGYLIFARELAAWEYLAAGCVGVLFLLIGMAGESIGSGDGALIMLYGFLFGLRRQLIMLFIAVLFCAAAAAVLMLTKKVKRTSRLPFVPFLLCGFCAALWMK